MPKFKFEQPKRDFEDSVYPAQMTFKIKNADDRKIYDLVKRLDAEQGWVGKQSIMRSLLLYAVESYEEYEKELTKE